MLAKAEQKLGREAANFEIFRDEFDTKTAEHYGARVIPRISVLSKKNFEQIIDSGRYIVDNQDQLLACDYADAYSNSTAPEGMAYLLKPAWEISQEDVELIKSKGYLGIMAEVVVPHLYEAAKTETESCFPKSLRKWQESLVPDSAQKAQLQLSDTPGFQLIEGTGDPLLHFEYNVSLDKPEELEMHLGLVDEQFVDTFENREEVKRLSEKLVEHNKVIFDKHSEESGPVDLNAMGLNGDLEDPFDRDDYVFMLHKSETKKDEVDAALLTALSLDIMPCVDPQAFSVDKGVYVDTLSTDGTERGSMVAPTLISLGMKYAITKVFGGETKDKGVCFDTAGHSTLVIPALVILMLKRVGFAINQVRVDSIHTIAMDLSNHPKD